MISLVLLQLSGWQIYVRADNHRVAYRVLPELIVLEVISIDRLDHIVAQHRVVALLHIRRVTHWNLMLMVDWDCGRGRKLSYFDVWHWILKLHLLRSRLNFNFLCLKAATPVYIADFDHTHKQDQSRHNTTDDGYYSGCCAKVLLLIIDALQIFLIASASTACPIVSEAVVVVHCEIGVAWGRYRRCATITTATTWPGGTTASTAATSAAAARSEFSLAV